MDIIGCNMNSSKSTDRSKLKTGEIKKEGTNTDVLVELAMVEQPAKQAKPVTNKRK